MPGFEWFGDEERAQVQDVLDSGVLMRYGFDAARNGHWKAQSLETELARRLNVAHCHVLASGTAALSTALAMCGIGAGDEVIVPPFTFVATVEAVMFAGAVPVFVDIDKTLCLNPEAIAEAITPRTRAVIAVHMCGSMARIEAIAALCAEKELMLIEDACQAVGGAYHGRALGTFGHAGCFSFDPVKTITCGEGGAVITNDPNRYALAHAFADHGHDHIGNDRGLENHAMMGLNFRISELNAAVGLAQLRKLDAILECQRNHKAILKQALGQVSGLEFRSVPDPAGDTATFLSFMLPDADSAARATAALAKEGVDGCVYWYPNNWHYIRQWHHIRSLSAPARMPIALVPTRPDYDRLDLTQSDAIMARTISMPIKLSWSESAVAERADRMAHILGQMTA